MKQGARLLLGRSTELVSGDSKNEIKQTKTLVKLAHCNRHWFMNLVVCVMETNSKNLGTMSPILWSIQIKSRQLVWWVHSTTQNIEYKHYTGDRTPLHKSFKAQKSTPMLIRWPIINISPTRTTQSILDKPFLNTFNLVYTHIIEWAPYTASVFQLRTNQRRNV
jgi:hypothetical protein